MKRIRIVVICPPRLQGYSLTGYNHYTIWKRVLQPWRSKTVRLGKTFFPLYSYVKFFLLVLQHGSPLYSYVKFFGVAIFDCCVCVIRGRMGYVARALCALTAMLLLRHTGVNCSCQSTGANMPSVLCCDRTISTYTVYKRDLSLKPVSPNGTAPRNTQSP